MSLIRSEIQTLWRDKRVAGDEYFKLIVPVVNPVHRCLQTISREDIALGIDG